jgi:pimeloyl-ACP methyl ester carboxylesterase
MKGAWQWPTKSNRPMVGLRWGDQHTGIAPRLTRPNLRSQGARLSPMSTFVLVHGAWQSAGTWDLLGPLLEKHGHRVITPVLSGLGTDQSRLSPDITLQQHVEDVSVALSRSADRVILVGHSYAGMIISGVAEINPTQVRRLVFLDAFIPEDEQSVLDLLPPEISTYFRSVARDHGDGWRLPGGSDNSISGDLSPARRVILYAPDYVILVCVALRSPSVFRPIGRPAFHPPSSPALRKNIQRGRSSLHFQPKLVLWAGRSPN